MQPGNVLKKRKDGSPLGGGGAVLPLRELKGTAFPGVCCHWSFETFPGG